METIVKTHCPEYLEAWNNLPRMIMKIDIFRIMLMYVFGGIWVDFDYHFFKTFDLLEHKIVLTCNKEDEQGNPISVANALMASQPNQPFWKNILDSFFNQIKKSDKPIRYQSEWDVIRETGPQFLSKIWKEYLPKEDIYVPERKLFHPPSLNSTYNYKYIEELRDSGIYGIHFCTSLSNFSFGLWRNIWTFMVSHCSCNKWNCRTNFWYKKYINVIWDCVFKSPNRIFFRSLSRGSVL